MKLEIRLEKGEYLKIHKLRYETTNNTRLYCIFDKFNYAVVCVLYQKVWLD